MTKLTPKQRSDLLDYEREIEEQKRAEAEAEASEGLAFFQKRFRHQKNRVWTPSDAACVGAPEADGADAADGVPPRLTGGDRKTEALIAPYQIDWSQFQNVEYFSHWLTDTKGRILEVPLRKGKRLYTKQRQRHTCRCLCPHDYGRLRPRHRHQVHLHLERQ